MFFSTLSTCARSVCALSVASVVAWGATNDFTPTAGDWNLGSNWSLNHAPLLTEDVTIGTGKTVTLAITTTPMAIAANSITVATGGALNLTSGTTTDAVELTIATNLTVNGQMTAGGALNGVMAQIVFTNGAPQITGTGSLTFGNSTFSTGSNGIMVQDNAALTLGGTITVAGTAWVLDQVTAADGTTLSAVVTIGSGATMTIPSGTLSLNDGINLTNSGTLNLGSGANLIYDSNTYSDFTQTAGGLLNWTLNGNSLSAFLSPYSVHLAGTLALTRPSTYFPSVGDTVTLFNLVQSNMIGNFTTFTGTTNFSNDFVLASRTYNFSFLRDLQTITWSQTITAQAINGANLDLMAMSDASSSTSYVTYTVALASGGASTSTIIASTGPNVRAQLHPGSVGENIVITAHAASTGNYDNAMPLSSSTIAIAAPATVAITTPAGGFTYGDALVATATPSAAITWTTTNTAVVAIPISGATATIIGVGSASVTATSAATSSNPAGTATLALGTINPKAIVVTVANQTRIVGAANPTNSFTVTGLVNGDTVATLGTPTYAGVGATADATTAVGSYALTVSFPAISVYSISAGTAASLTITAAPVVPDSSPVSSGGGCGAGGGIALILGALTLAYRRRA